MQRRRSWTTDVAFADVAMAVLGPVLLLLVLFVLYSVRETRPPACTILDDAAIGAAGTALSAWAAETRRDLEDATLEQSCGPAPPIPAGMTGMTPAVLSGLCQPTADAVTAAAGLDRQKVQDLSARRSARERHASTCLASLRDNSCRHLEPAARRTAASDLSVWMQRTQSLTDRSVERMRRDCPVILGAPARDVPPPAIPPALAGLCLADRTAVLAAAGTIPAEVEAVERAQRESLARLRVCEPSVDRVEVKQEQLQFATCSTLFLDPATQQPMDPEAIGAFFQTLAGEVANRLSGGAYNRIDIFGHTDNRPFTGTCEGAQDNPALSSLRAHAFRRELEAAIRRDPAFAALAQRLDQGRLRIYAIGVGAAEPVVPNAQSERDHAINRRIELRFATDQRPGPR